MLQTMNVHEAKRLRRWFFEQMTVAEALEIADGRSMDSLIEAAVWHEGVRSLLSGGA